MSYALTFLIKLLPADTGLVGGMYGNIYTNSVPRGAPTVTAAGAAGGFIEIGNGEYSWSYSFADNFIGTVDFYTVGAVYQTSTAIEPPDVNIVKIDQNSAAAVNLSDVFDGATGGPAKFTTLATTGAVSFGTTFDVSGLTTLNALTVTNATNLNTLSTSGAVSFGTTFNVGGTAIEDLVSDQVWDELIAGHLGLGSTGEKLNVAGAPGAGDVISIAGDATAATNLRDSLQGNANNIATKGADLDNLKTVKDSINTKIDTQTIMSIDQLKDILQP